MYNINTDTTLSTVMMTTVSNLKPDVILADGDYILILNNGGTRRRKEHSDDDENSGSLLLSLSLFSSSSSRLVFIEFLIIIADRY